jgi:hypothetical protein
MKDKPFSVEEIELIVAKYSDTKTEYLAKQLNRSIRSIYGIANKLKLRKSESFLKSASSGRLQKGTTFGNLTTFKKGHIPKNKGKKLEEFMRPETAERFRANMFKKGCIPHNAYKDGMETICTDTDGRKYIKIKVSGVKKLVLKHYKVYLEAFGNLPEGYIITFKDGNTLNCNPENLKAITRQENMLRNSIHRFPEELKSVIRLLSKLNKKTQSYEKQN